jgi:hypothetical protein
MMRVMAELPSVQIRRRVEQLDKEHAERGGKPATWLGIRHCFMAIVEYLDAQAQDRPEPPPCPAHPNGEGGILPEPMPAEENQLRVANTPCGCSFCGKSVREVRWLICGRGDSAICDECLVESLRILVHQTRPRKKK